MPLIVPTYIRITDKKGIGLFSKEFIPNKNCIYYTDSFFDKVFDSNEVENFIPLHKNFIYEYASFNKKEQQWYLCSDNARYFNHSFTPNTFYDEKTKKVFTLRDIYPDEELTSNYEQFCDDFKDNKRFLIYQ